MAIFVGMQDERKMEFIGVGCCWICGNVMFELGDFIPELFSQVLG